MHPSGSSVYGQADQALAAETAFRGVTPCGMDAVVIVLVRFLHSLIRAVFSPLENGVPQALWMTPTLEP
jgi:hypothetical protein